MGWVRQLSIGPPNGPLTLGLLAIFLDWFEVDFGFSFAFICAIFLSD
jgi:hypothetical protein